MATAFYLVELPRCPCGKAATHKVQGSGNQDYMRAGCKKCAERRMLELRAAYAVYDSETAAPAAKEK
jgi:hypothetical protein